MTDPGRRRPAAPTIYDIAAQAGVSASTVSRALNKPGRINAETERRIREAADAIGYRLNPMARSLQTGLTGNIGLIVSDLTNPAYFSFVRGAERVTAEAGSTLLFADSQERPEVELETAERMVRVADGLVLVGSRLEDSQILALARAKPVITVNRVVEGLTAVAMDVVAGLDQLLEHVRDLGHGELAYLSGPQTSWMNARRREVLAAGAARRGIRLEEVTTDGPTVAAGRASIDDVLATGATAVLAYNDLLAFGLLRGAHDAGVSVPGRLSILGFDDIFGADLLTPSLTTVRSPMGLVGEHAVRAVLREVGGEPRTDPPELPTELVVRESSGPVRRG